MMMDSNNAYYAQLSKENEHNHHIGRNIIAVLTWDHFQIRKDKPTQLASQVP